MQVKTKEEGRAELGQRPATLTPVASHRAVREGLDFILGHFQTPLFPRKVMTKRTFELERYQCQVTDKDEVMRYFEESGYLDCRINAFGVNETRPSLIFIELDYSDFGGSMRAFKLALTRTLKNIEKELDGGHPTVYQSGNGIHVLQPINCMFSLDDREELIELEPRGASISNDYLRFAATHLSANKRDRKNYPSIKSCLVRIPSSVNSKNNAEVKIIQRWDGKRPDFRLLVGSFHSSLVSKELERRQRPKFREYPNAAPGQVIYWIEKLLQTGIDDNRKDIIFWVLAPYLIRVRHLEYNEASDIIEEWLDLCDDVRSLQIAGTYVGNCLQYAENKNRWPISLNTFKEHYPNLASSIIGNQH